MTRFVSHGQLSQAYGFEVPPAFATWLTAAIETRGQAAAGDELIKSSGVRFAGPVARLLGAGDAPVRRPTDPPEFRAFAEGHANGPRIGFLVLAPELTGISWSIAEIDPTVEPACASLGTTFTEVVEHLVSRQLAFLARPGSPPITDDTITQLSVLGAALAIAPNIARATNARPPTRRPRVPDDYDYLRTSDGVGVAVPTNTLVPWTPNAWSPFAERAERDDLAAIIVAADDASTKGFHGTALHWLNETFARHNEIESNMLSRLIERRARAYDALGRKAYGDVVRAMTSA